MSLKFQQLPEAIDTELQNCCMYVSKIFRTGFCVHYYVRASAASGASSFVFKRKI